MSRLQDPARIVWSLASSGGPTTITANGNSGAYSPLTPNFASAVDLRTIEDILLTVYVTGPVTGTTPTLLAQLDLYDDLGNLIPGVLKTPTVTGAGGSALVSGGVHGATTAASIVFPLWARVSWVVTGTTPVFQGAQIALFGR